MSDNISARQNDSSGPRDSAGDGQLSAPPPVFTEAEAEGLARNYFGLTGQATRLTSERDANFRIRNGGGSHVLKIANPAEAPEVTNLQTMAQLLSLTYGMDATTGMIMFAGITGSTG